MFKEQAAKGDVKSIDSRGTNSPQVEYAATARGRAFEPVFRAIKQAAG